MVNHYGMADAIADIVKLTRPLGVLPRQLTYRLHWQPAADRL